MVGCSANRTDNLMVEVIHAGAAFGLRHLEHRHQLEYHLAVLHRQFQLVNQLKRPGQSAHRQRQSQCHLLWVA